MSEKIISHHIGGRSGTRAFPVLDSFEKDVVNVLYDADPDCAAQTERLLKDSPSETRVLPFCLGAKNGTARFNIGYDPYTSSVLLPNPEKKSWYFYYRKYQHDYILGETFKPMKRIKLPIVTLDTLIQKNRVPVPDIISVDVQGAEWEVLKGAQKTLTKETLAVIAEVEFHQLYKGQKLFGDIQTLLGKQGFQFVQFTKYFTEFSPYRYPVGLRGKGFQSSTDALFLKDIDVVKKEKPALRRNMLKKLAFIAIVYGQFEYGFECLATLSKMKEEIGVTCSYQKFLTEVWREVSALPRVFPPTFKDQFTFADSQARFAKEASEKKGRERSVSAKILRNASDSALEKVFRSYALVSQADLLKKVRLQQE